MAFKFRNGAPLWNTGIRIGPPAVQKKHASKTKSEVKQASTIEYEAILSNDFPLGGGGVLLQKLPRKNSPQRRFHVFSKPAFILKILIALHERWRQKNQFSTVLSPMDYGHPI